VNKSNLRKQKHTSQHVKKNMQSHTPNKQKHKYTTPLPKQKKHPTNNDLYNLQININVT